MATQNITINYPDGQAARIMVALKAAAASRGIPDPTNAQALAWFAAGVRAQIRDMVLTYERDQALSAASAGVIPVDVT